MQHYCVQVSKCFDPFPFLKCYQFLSPNSSFFLNFREHIYHLFGSTLHCFITQKCFSCKCYFTTKILIFLSNYAFIHSENIYKVITTRWHIYLCILYLRLLSQIYLHDELFKCWSRSVWSSPRSLSIFCFFSCNTLILLKSWTFSSGKCSETDGFLLWEISLVNERLSACLLLSGTAGGLIKKKKRKIEAIQGCIFILKILHKKR